MRRFQFDAWGTYRRAETPGHGETAIGYTGHAYAAEVGLTYAQQRWLDTSTGRFLSEDPIGAGLYLKRPQAMNQWLYANGSPTLYTDPDGRTGLMFDLLMLALRNPEALTRTAAWVRDPAGEFKKDWDGGDRSPRPLPPHKPRVLQKYDEARHLEIQDAYAARTSPAALERQRWYRSLEPPTTTLSNGVTLNQFENIDNRAARQLRREVEFTIQTVDWGARAGLEFAVEAALWEVGAAGAQRMGRALVADLATASARAGPRMAGANPKPNIEPFRIQTDPAAYAGENYVIPADLPVPTSQRAATPFTATGAELGVEIDAAFLSNRVRSGTMIQFSDEGRALGGSGPKEGVGAIWCHDNVRVSMLGPNNASVQLRTHSPNPNAPAGSFSQSNYTTQINTTGGLYLLPDGTWKTIANMTPAERSAAHIPAGN